MEKERIKVMGIGEKRNTGKGEREKEEGKRKRMVVKDRTKVWRNRKRKRHTGGRWEERGRMNKRGGVRADKK